MRWRVMVELTGADGSVGVHEVYIGDCPAAVCSPETLGVNQAQAKDILAGVQLHLVQAQVEEYCESRRRCPRCRAQRPLKDRRPRRLRSLFGVIAVRAPRFAPCCCSETRHETLSPVGEIMPDRCTPEYERTLAGTGAMLPYRRARGVLDDSFPLGAAPVIETIRQRTLQVGARLECQALAPPRPAPPTAAKAITLSIDGGHVSSVRSYQARSFEVIVAQVSNDKQLVFASVPAEADHEAK
jgi:hypothetical protein